MRPEVLIAVALGAIASVEDLRRRSVPNWLTGLGVIAAGLCAGLKGWHWVMRAGAGTAAGFAIFLPLYALGAMGGGDIKLMAAFGAVLGPGGVVAAAFVAAIVGAAMAVVALSVRPEARHIPYAPAIALGAWAALLAGGF